jgi:eukaryotic-like serine/threonine-protein kinase
MTPPEESDTDALRDAELLDELLAAIQAGNAGRRDELLASHPHLLPFVDCLSALDSFAPQSVAPEFAETMIVVGSSMSQPARSTPVPPIRFGNYDLLGEVGRGGMGVVYKARHRDLNRIVALKMILASDWASVETIGRFQAEARAVARLRHRNIVGIHEVGEEVGRHFFAMDFVEGESLAKVISRGPMAPERAARWMVSIAEAVEHLHSQGLIHRDLKPSNILIDASGEPMVTDFGLAKAFGADGGATRTGAILGTPSYMSPEQASGRNALVTARSDVYSLGAMLYEMLSGRPPFREENPLDTLVQVLESEPTLLRQLVRTIPRSLELICFKCLEKDPARRYATAAELAADLARYLQSEPVEAQAGGLWQTAQRWVRRQPALACHLAALVPAMVLIQVYHALAGTDLAFHLRVTGLLGLWIGGSIVWQMLLSRERLAQASRIGASLTDAALLTALFLQAEQTTNGMLIVVYALLIVASGLWFQVSIVWWTTLIVELAFAVLTLNQPLLQTPWLYPLLTALTLAVLGAATAFQVQRVRALSRFYERRPL